MTTQPARIPVSLPSLLAHFVDGRQEVEVEAPTVRDCIDALLAQYPVLRNHLFDEEGELRQHVNVFYNDENLKWLDDWGLPVKEGDRLTVIQAVSGG